MAHTSAPKPWLETFQQRLRHLISAPEGVQSALAESGDPPASLAEWIRDDGRVTALERLDVYANAYFHRILGCLREDYGALEASLHEDVFHDLVTSYLVVNPPGHPSLRFAGEKLPEFLERHPGAEPFRRGRAWATDLARLEWAIVDAFDAPDALAATRQDLAALSPDEWDSLALHLIPTVGLLDLDWPVERIRRSFDRDEAPNIPTDPKPTRLCVWRVGFRVVYRSLESLEAECLHSLGRSFEFGALCERIAELESEAEAPALAAHWLARWVDDAMLGIGRPARIAPAF